MPPSASVVVFGSIMKDLTFTCDAFPARGQTVVGRLDSGQGGKGSNQAIASGRCGVPTVFVGATGSDGFAGEVKAFYARCGISCQLKIKAGASTGTAVILLDRTGQNQIVIAGAANQRLSAADLSPRLLASARVLLVQLEANQAATHTVLRRARAAGVTTILNPAPMRSDFAPAMLRQVDFLIPNETEFVELVRRSPASRRKDFTVAQLHQLAPAKLHALARQLGVPTVIITLGERGCFISQEQNFLAVPAHREVKVVDTTGAGDAFCGGFAAGWVCCEGRVLEAVQLGMAVAALSITRPGAAHAMPSRNEIRRFLKERKVALPFA